MNDGKLLHLLAHFKKLIVIESNIFSDSKPYIFSLFQGGGGTSLVSGVFFSSFAGGVGFGLCFVFNFELGQWNFACH